MSTVIVTSEESIRAIIGDEVDRRLQSQPEIVSNINTDFEWISNSDAMKMLSLSRPTLQRYRASGKLAFSKVGSNIYYRRTDLNNLLKDHLQSY